MRWVMRFGELEHSQTLSTGIVCGHQLNPTCPDSDFSFSHSFFLINRPATSSQTHSLGTVDELYDLDRSHIAWSSIHIQSLEQVDQVDEGTAPSFIALFPSISTCIAAFVEQTVNKSTSQSFSPPWQRT
ncbi:unnamed protein product [Protopolystoma xenopodis]|uniref:Uncharacterized protein n=1 Tax=Protopolystoma xenopodis TaxID=117903 RepID=A0A448WIK4_9PLAT|nr:unnamed protein product [Protopolystoma xenopodis]